MLDHTTWGVLAVALTALGAVATWWSFRRRGPAAGLRALAVTLLVPAAWLTGTLRLLGRIASATASWASGLAWSPVVWLGLGLAGLSLVLLVVAGRLPSARGRDVAGGARARGEVAPAPGRAPSATRSTDDPDLDEIEAILRGRGIS